MSEKDGTGPDWTSFRSWHALLDALCIARGHVDNLALAEQMCRLSGNDSREAFETMQRNLHNWRRGTHLPQRRNLVLLSRALDTAADKSLNERWKALYAAAREPGTSSRKAAPAPLERRVRTLSLALAGTGATTLALAGALVYLLFFQEGDRLGYSNIVYHRQVEIGIGESRVIHGRRAACGELPPDWNVIREELPEVRIGTWSDGGIGLRNSRSCGGPTPARALVLTAEHAGRAEFNLYDDPVTVIVE